MSDIHRVSFGVELSAAVSRCLAELSKKFKFVDNHSYDCNEISVQSEKRLGHTHASFILLSIMQ